jgi:hypothetical protein
VSLFHQITHSSARGTSHVLVPQPRSLSAYTCCSQAQALPCAEHCYKLLQLQESQANATAAPSSVYLRNGQGQNWEPCCAAQPTTTQLQLPKSAISSCAGNQRSKRFLLSCRLSRITLQECIYLKKGTDTPSAWTSRGSIELCQHRVMPSRGDISCVGRALCIHCQSSRLAVISWRKEWGTQMIQCSLCCNPGIMCRLEVQAHDCYSYSLVAKV